MADRITIETVMAGRLRDAGHANYGRLGSGTIWQHTTIPRLSAVDRPLRPEEPSVDGSRRVREWSVDGGHGGSIEAAVAALNVPPVLTEEEAVILARIPVDWIELHDFRTALGDDLGKPVGIVILMLRHKGMIENELRPGEPRARPWIRRVSEVPA